MSPEPGLQTLDSTELLDSVRKNDTKKTLSILNGFLKTLEAMAGTETFIEPGCVQFCVQSLWAGDKELANTFSALMVKDLSHHLEEYGNQLSRCQDRTDYQSLIYTIYQLIRAFVPFIKNPGRLPDPPPDIPLMLPDDACALIAQIIRVYRPELDKNGWMEWNYPVADVRDLRYRSAYALTRLGIMLKDRNASGHDIDFAWVCSEESLNLTEGSGTDELTADLYNLRSRICEIREDLHAAVANAELSLSLEKALGNARDAAIDAGNLGGILIRLAAMEEAAVPGSPDAAGHYASAREHLTAAAGYFGTSGQTCDQGMYADTLNNLASYYRVTGDKKKAYDFAITATQITLGLLKKNEPFTVNRMLGLCNAAEISRALGHDDQAGAYYELVRRVAEASAGPLHDNPELNLMLYGGLGELCRNQKNYAAAYRYLSAAAARLDCYHASFLSGMTGMHIIKRYRRVYESLIACCTELGTADRERRAEAFATAEKTKWRLFITWLRYQELGIPIRNPSPGLRERMQRERYLLSRVRELTLTVSPPGEDIGKLPGYQKELEEIWSFFSEPAPDYVAIRKGLSADAHDVSSLLDDEVPFCVEYYLGEGSAKPVAFIITRGSDYPDIVPLGADGETIAGMVSGLRSAVATKPLSEVLVRSRELFHGIMEPVLRKIPEGSGICIIPCGCLHNLPFNALHDGTRYLIERNPLVISTSGTALNWWKKKNRSGSDSCLIFSATTDIYADGQKAKDLLLFKNLAEEHLAPLFNTPGIIHSPDSTKQRLLKELSPGNSRSWDVLHIACHGEFNPNDVLSSRLLLSGDRQDPAKDISVPELFALRVQASLVTLSACQTGITSSYTGDEVVGINQAFLFAGSSSVLASLWVVDQEAGVLVTSHFYRLWKKSDRDGKCLTKIRALQQAQVDVLRKFSFPLIALSHPWSHPYLWACFQLYGDWK